MLAEGCPEGHVAGDGWEVPNVEHAVLLVGGTLRRGGRVDVSWDSGTLDCPQEAL